MLTTVPHHTEKTWVKTRQQVTPVRTTSMLSISDDEFSVLEVPNQNEINDAATRLQVRLKHNDSLSSRAAVNDLEALFKDLERLHDDASNEKAVLYNKLHQPLEAFSQLLYIEGDATYNFRWRANKLLSLWKNSLNRRVTIGKTPLPRRFTSLASTPPGTLFIPRSISNSPEPDIPADAKMDLDSGLPSKSLTRSPSPPPVKHSLSPSKSLDSDQTSLRSHSVSDEEKNLPVGNHYNLRGAKGRKPLSTSSRDTAVSTTDVPPGKPASRVNAPSPSTIVLRRSDKPQSDISWKKRKKQRNDVKPLRTLLRTCMTRDEVHAIVAERVGPMVNEGEVFDVQSKSSLPVSEYEIDRLVRARVSDEDYVSDICDIPGHYDRITYLEAKCDLLTRRNVALEGERARLRGLAQRAMYGEEANPWNGRQQALDQLVEEILE